MPHTVESAIPDKKYCKEGDHFKAFNLKQLRNRFYVSNTHVVRLFREIVKKNCSRTWCCIHYVRDCGKIQRL